MRAFFNKFLILVGINCLLMASSANFVSPSMDSYWNKPAVIPSWERATRVVRLDKKVKNMINKQCEREAQCERIDRLTSAIMLSNGSNQEGFVSGMPVDYYAGLLDRLKFKFSYPGITVEVLKGEMLKQDADAIVELDSGLPDGEPIKIIETVKGSRPKIVIKVKNLTCNLPKKVLAENYRDILVSAVRLEHRTKVAGRKVDKIKITSIAFPEACSHGTPLKIEQLANATLGAIFDIIKGKGPQFPIKDIKIVVSSYNAIAVYRKAFQSEFGTVYLANPLEDVDSPRSKDSEDEYNDYN